jgi:hypothetical protein
MNWLLPQRTNWPPPPPEKKKKKKKKKKGAVGNGREWGGAREVLGKNIGWQISGTHLKMECLNLTSHLLKKHRTGAVRD